MDKKEYKAPKLQSCGSIEKFTFTQGGNNEDDFQYFNHYWRRRPPYSWKEQNLPTFSNS